MEEYSFRIARLEDKPAIVRFMNTHWGIRHPLVNLPDFFTYYYAPGDGTLRFALAEQGGALAAIAGFIPANSTREPDIWASIWVADKACNGAGLELMAALPALTGCRTLACNNIRPKTRAFYEFLGYTTGRVGHFYRLADQAAYSVAHIENKIIPPVAGDASLAEYPALADLQASGFIPPPQANPYKDFWYISRRYYAYPHQCYRVFGAVPPGESAPAALLVVRRVPVLATAMLRIADYIGPADFLPCCGPAIDALLRKEGAEYAELYCAGLNAALLYKAGFAERTEESADILPNYLDPLRAENTEYYYFTSRPRNFTLFKADGDQDRPNIPLPPAEA